MCLGLSCLPKYPFRPFSKSFWPQTVDICFWNVILFHCFKELCLIYAAERVLWMECKSCFWEGQADFLRCACVYADNYWEESIRSLVESKCSYFTHLLLPELVRPNRIKNCLESCTPPSSPSWSLKVLVSHQGPSVTGFAWATGHCEITSLYSQPFIVCWMSISIATNSTCCTDLVQ